MNICLFLPDLRGGGAERVALDLAEYWVSEGCQITIVLMHADGALLSEVPPQIELIDLKCPRNWSSLAAFIRYIRKSRPDVILSFMPIANGIAGLARTLVASPPAVVATEHNSRSLILNQPNTAKELLLSAVLKTGYRRTNAIVAVSKGVQAELEGIFDRTHPEIVTIYNPVHTTKIRLKAMTPHCAPSSIPLDKPLITSIGRLTAQKDFPTLIRAFKILKRDFPSRLLILGDDVEGPRLRELIRHLDLENDVIMPGFVPNPWCWLGKSRLYVMSSVFEGFGLVLVEALALGLPIVATDCPHGPREILADGKYGYLAPPGDASALAAGMKVMIHHNLEPPILQARADEFDITRAANSYLELFKRLLQSSSKYAAN